MQTTSIHKAAKQLVGSFNGPTEFISILCDLINASNQYPEPDHEKNGIFLLQRLIQGVAISWVLVDSAGGSEQDKTSLIAANLTNLLEELGTRTYNDELRYISLAEIHAANTTGAPSKEYALLLLKSIQVLYSIGDAFREYESMQKKAA